MTRPLAMIANGKKFMWDGNVYATREEAGRASEAYQNDNFEVRIAEEDGTFLVYTRRAIKEVVVAAR